MEKVCEEWNVKKVVFQADRELRSDIVEESMENLLCSMNIKVKLELELQVNKRIQRWE